MKRAGDRAHLLQSLLAVEPWLDADVVTTEDIITITVSVARTDLAVSAALEKTAQDLVSSERAWSAACGDPVDHSLRRAAQYDLVDARNQHRSMRHTHRNWIHLRRDLHEQPRQPSPPREGAH